MQKLVEKLGLSEGAASAALWVILSVVLLAIVALLALWLVRTLRPSLNMNGGARGGRPQRLAITDAFPLDRDGRKLVIVRRDNTEHLLLIGGPNDVLIEGNITRYDRTARGGQARLNDGDEETPVAVAPPAPVAPPMMAPPVMAPPVMAPPQAPVVVSPPPAPAVAPSRRESVPQPPLMHPAPPPPAPPPAPAPIIAPPPVLTLETLLADAQPVKNEPPAVEVRPIEVKPPVEPKPVEPPAPVLEPAPAPQAPPPRPPAMSEMARRLNEALQKPVTGTLRPPFNRSIPPAPPTAGPSASPTPPVTPVAPPPAVEPPPPPTPEAKPAAPAPEPVVAKADMDLLEEEMARLLGRPAQPKKPDVS